MLMPDCVRNTNPSGQSESRSTAAETPHTRNAPESTRASRAVLWLDIYYEQRNYDSER